MIAHYRHRFAAMTTACEIQLYGLHETKARHVAQCIRQAVYDLVERYNFHSDDSWLSRAINGRREWRVDLDEETRKILACVREHAEITEGVFDITVGTCARALRQANSHAEAHIIQQDAAPWMGLDRWWLEHDQLCFDNPHTQLDLGGVIKEYAVDLARQIALRKGVTQGLINFGGDLSAIGCKPDGQRFVAAVPDPTHPEKMLFALDLENQALTTSGHYARQRRFADGSVSHIIGDKRSNQNAATQWLSASVVSSQALVSGIYSTALLIKPDVRLPADITAVTVDRDRRVHALQTGCA